MDLNDFVLKEIERHVAYFRALNRKSELLSKEIEKLSFDVMKKDDEGEEPLREDFFTMNMNTLVSNLIMTDLIKTSSRISVLYQLAVSGGLLDKMKVLPDFDLIERIASEYSNMFIVDSNGCEIANPEVKSFFEKRSDEVVPTGKEDLKRAVSALKEEYEKYEKARANVKAKTGQRGS